MNGYSGTLAPPGGMYVRALYDYEADDRTSLSFRQGDIIQVITQLESGWWDGVINGVRGWFPSNYCAVISRPIDDGRDESSADEGDGATIDGSQTDLGSFSEASDTDDDGGKTSLPLEGTETTKEEEAAFWIPQATPDGRLFYFNTLTGVSTMELPLETPSSLSENGPRDRTNVNMPEMTRPPPELMAGGWNMYNGDTDDENSASDVEGPMAGSHSSLQRRRSFTSNGVSPATSMDSIGGGLTRSRSDLHENAQPSGFSGLGPPLGTTLSTYANNSWVGGPMTSAVSRQFFDDAQAVPLTWNRMVEDMRRSVERYRQAISNSDRSEFVKRAEDISDHLRLLLAAGSGTTDNHSGNPSIISANKALYPHFRETMSRFSKLVLSSHIAAADWPPPDSYSKCLKEADGVLNGVYGFVEVARQQRGEDIPRLIPGFIIGSFNGGNWQSNGLSSQDPMNPMSFIDQDDQDEPSTRLDDKLVERLDDLKRFVVSSIRKLEERLELDDKVITNAAHKKLGDRVCKSCTKILEVYRPWISTVESINLAPIGSTFQNPQVADFSIAKQKVYDMISELILAVQAVGAPLGDEWAENRGEAMEDRLNHVRNVAQDLESNTAKLYFSLQLLSDLMPMDDSPPMDSKRYTESDIYNHYQRKGSTARALLDEDVPGGGNNAKLKKFFGEVPAPVIQQQAAEEIPEFLQLDHEGEISYDFKTTPPALKGGTLAGLVEQLTRHDRLDSPFNNTFLLTYRSFTTAAELFEMLVKRWSIQPPAGLSREDYQLWVDKKQKPIRFRVVNILKSWFDNYWMEDNNEEAQALIQRVYAFAKDHVATSGTPGATPLMAAVEQRARGQDAPSKRLVLTLNTQTPQPILPKHMKKLKFLDIDATEFARQLTIIESRLYGKIRPTECLNKTWQKKLSPGEADPASNVKALILHSNQLTNWVAQMILTQQDVKRRVVVIKHFVSVADKCRMLNNFSTLTSIISALGTAPIHRLGRTWTAVNARTMATLENMRRLMGSTKNFAEYRDTLHKANPPCIPFFGVYLTDLTFIEDGIPSLIKKTNLINFAKRAKTAEVIRDIQQYQNVPYPLQPVPELQDYILTNMQSAGDVHEMYDMSLQVEPREREDEKIARYVASFQRRI
ncbi:ras guanine nucleotide exchange factor domain-containing protein [Phyllosticta citrichinensis]|uniref:Ras guanine nucleotide exchange factor domain-containing protein n=1 Tax=Phyllosticta citrichinensis TaxID=1130410 RepID=A0ABR1XQ52_9PEZI